jgi:hypothetical protein
VPLFPESKAIINLGSREGGTTSRAILSVNDGGLEENLEHYERELSKAGYRPESSEKQPAGEHHRILLFRKQGSEVTVNLSTMAGKRIRVHIMVVDS